MGVKVATGCLNWSQPSISHSTSSSTYIASSIPSPSSKRRGLGLGLGLTVCRYVNRSTVFGTTLNRSRSCETLRFTRSENSIKLKRIVSATFDSEYTDEESDRFLDEIQELAARFQAYDDNNHENENESDSEQKVEKQWYGDMIPASIERKANSLELPFSLRIIKRKKQLEDGFREAGDFAYCSIKKAFSSMVFIIRELQSYTLQMREVLFLEDLEGILMRVQKEMNASFVWLFQQVFSHTPNLMLYVMILLANYSVHSMSNHITVASLPAPVTVESISTVADQTKLNTKFDFVSSIGGINGGGGKSRPVSSGTDGDGKFDELIVHQTSVDPTGTDEESGSGEVYNEEELGLWKSVVAEAEEMQEVIGDGGIDRETMRQFVSPVKVEEEVSIESEGYFKTELVYQTGLEKEPDNPLLLANYAQFLYLFSQDHKRAEEYFKRASKIEPKDAEALGKYAIFLWHAKKDLWAAEETFLEAISADPNNSFYSGTYAQFLWNNGATDTCYPLE